RSLNQIAGATELSLLPRAGLRAVRSLVLTPRMVDSSGTTKCGKGRLPSTHSLNCSAGTRIRLAQNSGLNRAASMICLSIGNYQKCTRIRKFLQCSNRGSPGRHARGQCKAPLLILRLFVEKV